VSRPYDPSGYPSQDGRIDRPDLWIRFRGEERRVGDLTEEELRCALADAQNDLDVVAMNVADVLAYNPGAFSYGVAEELRDVERCARRHQVDRGRAEELEAAREGAAS
jgi:outer membrane PBP1 activator LpoA protein